MSDEYDDKDRREFCLIEARLTLYGNWFTQMFKTKNHKEVLKVAKEYLQFIEDREDAEIVTLVGNSNKTTNK